MLLKCTNWNWQKQINQNKLFHFVIEFCFTSKKFHVHFLLGESFFFRKRLPHRLNALGFFSDCDFSDCDFSGCDFSGSLIGVRGSSSTGFCFFGVKLPQVTHFSWLAIKNMKTKIETKNRNWKFSFQNWSLWTELLTIRHF